MKIVVMSDTHLSRINSGFEALCEMYCCDAHLVIHLGDWSSHSILHFMEKYPLEAVAGNMDDAVIHSKLPSRKVITLKRHRIGLIHGWGSALDLRERLRCEFSGVDAVLFGHTHQPFKSVEDNVFWFNPGSISLGRGSAPQSLGILHINDCIRGEIVPLQET